MRPKIERVISLNDLVESVPEEIYRQIQSESFAEEASPNENAEMPSDKKPSKSQRIRDYIEEHPTATAKQIVQALSEYGVKQADVGNARAKLKRDQAKQRVPARATVGNAPAPATSSRPSSVAGISVKALEAGTIFLKEAGSLSNARELLIVIDHIRSA